MYAACIDCKQAIDLGKSLTVHHPIETLETLTAFIESHNLHRIWFGSETQYYELPDWSYENAAEDGDWFAGVYKIVADKRVVK